MISIGIALEVVLAGLFVVVKRRQARSRELAAAAGLSQQNPAIAADASPPADLAGRLRVILSRILGTCLIVVPVAIAIAVLHQPGLRPVRLPRLPPRSAIRHLIAIPQHRGAGGEVFTIVLAVIQYGLIIALIAAVAAVIYITWLRRVPRVPMESAAAGVLDEFPSELARAVEYGRQALSELDDARAAIIGCYLAMERSLAKAGAARRAAETPDELLARAVAGDLVSAEPASRLTALFYEARFSSHPMPQVKRDEAAHSLAELAQTLPSDQVPAAGTAGGAQTGGTRR